MKVGIQQNAFLTATTDSIIIDSNFYHVFIHLGKTYKWTSLTNKNIDEEILSKIGFRDKLYNNKPFNESQLKNFFKKIILFYEKLDRFDVFPLSKCHFMTSHLYVKLPVIIRHDLGHDNL